MRQADCGLFHIKKAIPLFGRWANSETARPIMVECAAQIMASIGCATVLGK